MALPPMTRWECRALDEDEVRAFDLVAPGTARRARLVSVPLLAPGASGMTLGRWVLLRQGHERRPELVAHELVHVEQFADLRWRPFLWAYLRSYGSHRLLGLAHRAAYLAIPAEREARARTAEWSAAHTPDSR